MPKTLFQNVIFTLMMSFLMVYVMICYNICLNVGGMNLHHSCNLFYDRMYHVPLHESCCNDSVQERRK